MPKIERLTQQALGNLTRQMGEKEAQEFLRTQFPDLSDEDAKRLTRRIPPKRRRVVQKISQELEDEVKEVKVGDLDRFIKERFPSLPIAERTAIKVELTRLISPRPRRGAVQGTLQELIHQAVENVTQEMTKEEAQHYLLDHFPRLLPKEAIILAQPMPERQQAVGKVVGRLRVEAKKRRPNELRSLLEEKLDFRPSTAQKDLIIERSDSSTKPGRPSPTSKTIPARKTGRKISPRKDRIVSPKRRK